MSWIRWVLAILGIDKSSHFYNFVSFDFFYILMYMSYSSYITIMHTAKISLVEINVFCAPIVKIRYTLEGCPCVGIPQQYLQKWPTGLG